MHSRPGATTAQVILDVDTGIDDSLALLLACAMPEIDILAATCVSGNVAARQVAENTLAVLQLAGRTDIPVAIGRETPLKKPLQIATDTHGPRGIGYAELPPPSRPLADWHAADLIAEAARAKPGEITLVTLGPLTNLAVALEREPALPRLLRSWTLMGGAFGVPGNTTPTAEWNGHVDPDAAQLAFAAWGAAVEKDPSIPLPLAMGLDVTEKAAFVPEHMRALAVRGGARPLDAEALAHEPMPVLDTVADSPILHYVVDALRFYFEYHAANDGVYGAYIHDPFALAATMDRSLVTTKPVFVDVETGSGPAHGMTVADWRGLTKRPPNLDVAVDGNAEAFMRSFIDRVGGLAADAARVAR
jgi:purine nucleosidase